MAPASAISQDDTHMRRRQMSMPQVWRRPPFPLTQEGPKQPRGMGVAPCCLAPRGAAARVGHHRGPWVTNRSSCTLCGPQLTHPQGGFAKRPLPAGTPPCCWLPTPGAVGASCRAMQCCLRCSRAKVMASPLLSQR